MATKRAPKLALDFRSGLPAYAQIVRQVHQLAASGGLQAGDRLPTVRALAEELGLNFNTAARAYRVLAERGVVSTQRGRGTYILQRRARQQTLQTLAAHYIREAKRNKLADAEIVGLVARRLKSWKEPG
jgi:GntR family transcriptional regulator